MVGGRTVNRYRLARVLAVRPCSICLSARSKNDGMDRSPNSHREIVFLATVRSLASSS